MRSVCEFAPNNSVLAIGMGSEGALELDGGLELGGVVGILVGVAFPAQAQEQLAGGEGAAPGGFGVQGAAAGFEGDALGAV